MGRSGQYILHSKALLLYAKEEACRILFLVVVHWGQVAPDLVGAPIVSVSPEGNLASQGRCVGLIVVNVHVVCN